MPRKFRVRDLDRIAEVRSKAATFYFQGPTFASSSNHERTIFPTQQNAPLAIWSKATNFVDIAMPRGRLACRAALYQVLKDNSKSGKTLWRYGAERQKETLRGPWPPSGLHQEQKIEFKKKNAL